MKHLKLILFFLLASLAARGQNAPGPKVKMKWYQVQTGNPGQVAVVGNDSVGHWIDKDSAGLKPPLDSVLKYGNTAYRNIISDGNSFIKIPGDNTTIKHIIKNPCEFGVKAPGTIGVLAIKHAAVGQATMLDFDIKVYSYTYYQVAELRVSFYQNSLTSVINNGSAAYLITGSASTGALTGELSKIRAGIDNSGNTTLIIGDDSTNWGTTMNLVVESVTVSYNGGSSQWQSGWNIVNEPGTTGYTSLFAIPVDVMADRDWVQSQGYVTPSTETDPTVPAYAKTLVNKDTVFENIKTLDGSGSGLDADLLDGQHGTYYRDRANHSGTQAISTVSGLQTALDGKEDLTNKATTLTTANNTLYPTTKAAKDNDISAISITGSDTKIITLTRQNGDLIDSFTDNNTIYNAGYGLNLTGNSFIVDTTKLVPLDAGGKVSFQYLPATLMIYKGTWNPTTNTPPLADGSGTSGWVYKATWAGGTDSFIINLGSGDLTFYRGDYAIYNGSTWERSGSSDLVASVNGKQGVVILRISDIPDLQDSLNAKENLSNKVTTLTNSVTDYPTTSAVTTALSNAADNYIQNQIASNQNAAFRVAARSYAVGGLDVGTTSGQNNYTLHVATPTPSSSTYGSAIMVDGNAANVLTNLDEIVTNIGVSSGTALQSLNHFAAGQGSFSGTVTNQSGFVVSSSIVGGTNNFGFAGYIPAGTGRWNLYMGGTAQNYLEGKLGLGVTVPTETLDVDGKARIRTLNNAAGDFITTDTTGVLQKRTAAQVLSDIGASTPNDIYDSLSSVVRYTDTALMLSDYWNIADFTSSDITNWNTAYSQSHAAVTLTGEDYLSISGQLITANPISLAGTHVTDTLPVSKGGTGAVSLTGYVKGNGTGAMTASATIPASDITGLPVAPIPYPEEFTGTATNTVTLTYTPVAAAYVQVYLNGQLLTSADWGVSGTTLSLSFTLETSDVLNVYYSH